MLRCCSALLLCELVAGTALEHENFQRAGARLVRREATSANAASAASLLAKAEALSAAFGRAAESLNGSSPTRELLNSFRICGHCNKFERFGENHDGGYLMCMDGYGGAHSSGGSDIPAIHAAYSLGVEVHDQWSLDVADRLDVDVTQLDCTVAVGTCHHPRCKFYQKCAGADDGRAHDDDVWTMKELLQHTARDKASEGALLMKMDIEGSEWDIFEHETPATLSKFSQLIVEFHWLHDSEKHASFLKAVRNLLDADFRVVHLHGNNYGSMYRFGGESIPDVLEITFVRNAAKRKGGCSVKQTYNSLDAPNNPASSELPMANLK
eukprot:TRINITY_DN16196_c0_g1_i1.p1 TRINITY_DN16196_c0_g1~~TRINITY_DN16196_c0_g1_i1.p1  ORF type:complete len:324 (-),score=83.16 TRINITY_DN16196_c0_g1_i1:98-1069(-)